MRTIRPIKDRVLVKQDPPKEMIGHIHMLEGTRELHEDIGTVIAIGTDDKIPVAVGDRVMFKRRPSSALWDGVDDEFKDLIMLRSEDITAVVGEDL